MKPVDYRPPRWLRNPHLQSVLGSLPPRRLLGARALRRLGASHAEHVLDLADGTRLLGFHNSLPGREPRGLVLLLHGWEGSADSSYMRHSTAELLRRGFDVFRLNFRDHGDTHHLNEELFHSCRLSDVVQAAGEVARRFPQRPLLAAGYSLGGNFALRLALAAPEAGVPLAHAVAVCPALDPARILHALETGLPIYHWYFMRKWRRSLRRKRALFPHRHDFGDEVLGLDMRRLTHWMVQRHTDMAGIDEYFDGYNIAGDRLARLQVPVNVLAAADDPVIPFEGFPALRLPAHSRLEYAELGGHCGFLEGLSLNGYAERWVADRLEAAVAAAPAGRATMPASFSA
ncbi:YheT family hydrolase [Arenimonas fontis]|uniref:Alpha/beta fold hydrolase n=1 Tax=Arenimonas fontis TaxID=2608255 RepID=A0A5B2Z7P8_9GAMM|nr:alpha/beta fold hydrolase [Arenimonas fontis]KAA2284768.1 alpha/beta fold hydrolase [Arenimonas fontis]